MPEIHAVHDPADEIDHRDFVQSLQRPGNGVLVASITPGNRSTKGLTEDLLGGLGKRTGVGAKERHSGERWPKVIAWLVAEGVERLIVSRAHLLDGRAWQVLCELACACDFDLFLLVQRGSLTRGQLDQIERWPVALTEWPSFEVRFSATATAPDEEGVSPEGAPFPHVPVDEFTTFGAACRRQLSDEDFARVEDEVTAARASAREWLKEGVAEQALAAHLVDLVDDCADLDQALTRLRGVQLELFAEGYLLKLCVDVLAQASGARALPELTAAAADRLRRFSTTAHPAAGALALGGTLSPQGLVDLNVADVGDDGRRVSAGDAEIEIGAGAHPLVLSHKLFRLMEGAAPRDPLFLSELRQPGPKRYRRMPPAIMHALLAKASQQSGLALSRRHERPGDANAVSWMRRRGVSIQALPQPRPAPRSKS